MGLVLGQYYFEDAKKRWEPAKFCYLNCVGYKNAWVNMYYAVWRKLAELIMVIRKAFCIMVSWSRTTYKHCALWDRPDIFFWQGWTFWHFFPMLPPLGFYEILASPDLGLWSRAAGLGPYGRPLIIWKNIVSQICSRIIFEMHIALLQKHVSSTFS